MRDGAGHKRAAKALEAELSDDEGLDAIYRASFRPLCAAIARAFGRGPPEPEEVVQAAFAKFIVAKKKSRIENPKAFLYAAARNIVLDHKRHAKHVDAYVASQLAHDPYYELEEITPQRVLEEKERFNVMVAALKRLPFKQQVVITMNRVQGKTYEEIVKATGWSLGDISRNLNAGKAALMEALEAAERPRETPRGRRKTYTDE